MEPVSHAPPLARLLRPRAIALVGASNEPLSVADNARTNLRKFGYSGSLHLVSGRHDRIDGEPCLPSVDHLPFGIDAVMLAGAAAAVRAQVEACARRGVGGVVIFSAGFAEHGEAGRTEQEIIAAVAQGSGMALLGPNSLGFVNFADGIPLTFEPVEPLRPSKPGLCVIAQSGAMAGNIRNALHGRGVPVAFAISTGNQALYGPEDFLEALIDDASVCGFAVLVEQIRRPQSFLKLVRRARDGGKPVVLLHPGRSHAGAEAALAHTGAQAGSHAIMRAFVERAGAVFVDSLDEMFDTVALLVAHPRPRPGGLAVISNSGALRAYTFDLCTDIDLPLPAVGGDTATALGDCLPDGAFIANPLDLSSATMQRPELFSQAAAVLLADPDIGFLLISAMSGGRVEQLAKWQLLRPVLEAAQKPVALAFLGDDYALDEAMCAEIRASGIPFFRSHDRAIRAMGAIAGFARHLAAPDGMPEPFVSVAPLHVRHGPLAEWRSKKLLSEHGVSVPLGGLAQDLAEARLIAGNVGYPVALKAQADGLVHKSDLGVVFLNVSTAPRLDAAYDRLTYNMSIRAPDVTLDGVLVERMAPHGGLEMIIGAHRDPQWGPVLMVGLGGIWAEALNDIRYMPASAVLEEVLHELGKLRGGALLGGVRGSGARDVAAIARIATQIGAMMLADERILEVEINPLAVYPNGEGALALDARVVTV